MKVIRDNGTRLIKKEMKDLMMYIIGFAPISNGIFKKVYEDHQSPQKDRWSIETVNELIDMCNHKFGLDIKFIEVKENE